MTNEKPKHAFRDDNGMEARVWPNADGGWNVTLCELDSGETLPTVRTYPAGREAEAIAFAKGLVRCYA